MKNKFNLQRTLLALLLILMLPLAACAKLPEDLQIVLTTGLTDDEIFRMSGEVCTKTEFMTYLVNLQKKYEETYGTEIWELSLSDESLEERLKGAVLTQLEQIKIMKLMADDYAVTLSAEESSAVEAAAASYIAGLNETEKQALELNEEKVRQMYTEYALANALYATLIADVNPEISDDEARIVTVEQIGIRLQTTDKDGNTVPLTDTERQQARAKILEVKRRLAAGEEFDALISEYNEVGESILSFGHGEKEEAYETAAFNLGEGEISEVIETQEGYYLLKCISTFDQEETEHHKIEILEQRKSEAFDREYDAYRASVTEELNQAAYEEVSFLTDPGITTASFFETFDANYTSE